MNHLKKRNVKNLFLSLTILLAISSAFAQNINFPDSNAIWSVYNQKYFVDGDSSFNAVNYKKYYFSNDSIVTSGSFFALLREEILTKKIFAVSSGYSQEQLLYDFSLSINDTVSVYPLSFPFASGPILVKVESVDSVLIGDTFNRRLKIVGENCNSGHEEYWIEGIGSTMGIFNSGISGTIVTDIYYPTLLCFEKDEVILFHNPNFTDCYEIYPVGIKESEFFSGTKVYPNPASEFVTVEIPEFSVTNTATSFGAQQQFCPHTGELKLSLMNLNGQIIKTEVFDASERNHVIKVASLTPGMYMLHLTQKGKFVAQGKVMVVR